MTSTLSAKLEYVYDLGHFFNPKYPNLQNVKRSDLKSLSSSSPETKEAIRSFKAMMALPMDQLALKHHNRPSTFSSSIGPATEELFNIPRCNVPDYFPASPQLLKAESTLSSTGSWPKGCDENFPDHYSINISHSSPPSHLADLWPNIKKAVFRSYAQFGIRFNLVEFKHPTVIENIRVTFENLRRAIGLAQFNSQACRDHVFCKLDPSYRPSSLFDQWCRLFEHELGHNMNLRHTRGGTMNPTILSGSYTGWTEDDPSWPVLKRFFTADPIPPVPPTPPVPPVPPVPPTKGPLQGVVTIEGKLIRILESEYV